MEDTGISAPPVTTYRSTVGRCTSCWRWRRNRRRPYRTTRVYTRTGPPVPIWPAPDSCGTASCPNSKTRWRLEKKQKSFQGTQSRDGRVRDGDKVMALLPDASLYLAGGGSFFEGSFSTASRTGTRTRYLRKRFCTVKGYSFCSRLELPAKNKRGEKHNRLTMAKSAREGERE